MRSVYLMSALLGLSLLTCFSVQAQQSVSIGTSTIDRDAVLFLLGDGTQGLIIPKTDALASMPTKAGMLVYNTTDGQVYSCDGSTWTALGGGASGSAPVLQINGNNLSIFNGQNVPLALANPSTRGQILMWNGTGWTVNATTAPVANDVLVFNGTQWVPSGNYITGINGTAPINVVTTNNTAQVTISNITNNEISNTANIADSKLATISTAGKVSGTAINSGTIGGSTAINTTGNITTTGTLGVTGTTTLASLSGVGNRMMIADANGVITTAPLPIASTLTNLTSPNPAITIGNGNNAVIGLTPVTINIANASGSQAGLLNATDFTTFSNKQNAITLTTTGTSGAATLVGNTLNIPNYASTTYSNGTGLTLTGNTFSVNTSQNISNLTNLSTNGLVRTTSGTGALSIATAGTDYAPATTGTTILKGNGSGGFANAIAGTDYLTTNQAITLSGDVSGSGTTAITTSIAATAGNSLVSAINNAGTTGTINDNRLATISTAGKVSGNAITTGTIGGNTVINTTGTATVSGLTIGSTAINWPANAGGVLTNNGTGTLTWAPAAGTGDLLSTNNLSDLADAVAARTNLGLGSLSTLSAVGSTEITDGTIANVDILNVDASKITGTLPITQGGTGAATAPLARTALGLGTLATLSAVTSTEITDGTITDIDIAPGAAIAGTKITPNFGFGNIATGGTINVSGGATLSSPSLQIGVLPYTWPAVHGPAGAVLTNNGAGVLSWSSVSGWGLTGNAATVDGTNYIGTSDNVPLNFRVNNQRAGRIEAAAATANSFYGYQAGNVNTGTFNAAFGHSAMTVNTSGQGNAALGYRALANNTTGSSNTSMGFSSLSSNTTGGTNTAVGSEALRNLVVGSDNTAVGQQALRNATGSANVALGSQAAVTLTSGNDNAALGSGALFSTTTGSTNTAVGNTALSNNVTGSANTALGYNAEVATGALTNATAIGANSSVTTSNTIQLGDAAVTTVNVGTGTTAKLVAGQLQITGGTLLAGQVLTSDALGNATWQSAGGGGWGLTGNAGTNPATNFVGTTDAQPLRFATGVGGVERMRIDAAGNVGIGTAAPTVLLDVRGADNSNIDLTGVSGVKLRSTVSTSFSEFGNVSNHDLHLFTNNNVRMAITAAGNVGIGTSAPASTFQVGNTLSLFHDASGPQDIVSSNVSFDGSTFRYLNSAGASAIALGNERAGIFTFASGTAGNTLITPPTMRFNVTNTGVGVEVDNPIETFQVNGATYLNPITAPADPTDRLYNILGDLHWNGINISAGGGGGWGLTGNAGTNPATQFIGTSDAQDLKFKVNGQHGGEISQAGTLANTSFGFNAAPNGTASSANTAFGTNALNSVTSGNNNVAVGTAALQGNSTGSGNTAVGSTALTSNNGDYNAAVGLGALNGNSSGSYNTALGTDALRNSNATGNTAVGTFSLFTNSSGINNTAIGYNSDVLSASLSNATAIGYNAKVGASNSLVLGGTGGDAVNVGIGTSTPATRLDIASPGLWDLSSSEGEFRLGSPTYRLKMGVAQGGGGAGDAYIGAQGGSNRIFIGGGTTLADFQTMAVTAGKVGIGNAAPTAVLDVVGDVRLAPGIAPVITTDKLYNVGSVLHWNGSPIGGGGGWGLIGNGGTNPATNFIGTTDAQPLTFRVNNQQAGLIQSATPFSTFFGYQAGLNNGAAQNNTAVGYQALSVATSAGNTAFGYQAMRNTNGGQNVAMGDRALQTNTAGSLNTAIGWAALSNPTNTANNTAIGGGALQQSTGGGNAALGTFAAAFNSSGSNNVFVGYQAGYPNASVSQANLSGSNNTFIGANTGLGSSTQRTNATAIGANALVDADNALVLGGTGANAVKVGIGTANPTVALDIAAVDAVNLPRGATGDRPATPATGAIRFNTDENVMEYYNGSEWYFMVPKVAIIRDEKPNGTEGGIYICCGWQTRDLNTVVGDNSVIVGTITSNQFTLSAGEYIIEATAPMIHTTAAATDSRLRLRNLTDGTFPAYSSSQIGITYMSTQNSLFTTLAINSNKIFEIQQSSNYTNGLAVQLGSASGSGVNEIYTQVKITKLR